MAVFTFAEWTRLQEHLDRPVKTWSKAEGIGAALTCGVCGERLYLNLSKRGHHTYRCRKTKHASAEPGATVIAANADAVVEADFLGRFGHLPVTERVLVGDSTERDEAIARARMTLDAVRRAQDATDDDEEADRLHRAYMNARRDLRAAEALPSGSTEREIETGRTFAQAWADAGAPERTRWLLAFGPWVVKPGRMIPTEKVHLADRQPDYLAGQVDYGDGESCGPCRLTALHAPEPSRRGLPASVST